MSYIKHFFIKLCVALIFAVVMFGVFGTQQTFACPFADATPSATAGAQVALAIFDITNISTLSVGGVGTAFTVGITEVRFTAPAAGTYPVTGTRLDTTNCGGTVTLTVTGAASTPPTGGATGTAPPSNISTITGAEVTNDSISDILSQFFEPTEPIACNPPLQTRLNILQANLDVGRSFFRQLYPQAISIIEGWNDLHETLEKQQSFIDQQTIILKENVNTLQSLRASFDKRNQESTERFGNITNKLKEFVDYQNRLKNIIKQVDEAKNMEVVLTLLAPYLSGGSQSSRVIEAAKQQIKKDAAAVQPQIHGLNTTKDELERFLKFSQSESSAIQKQVEETKAQLSKYITTSRELSTQIERTNIEKLSVATKIKELEEVIQRLELLITSGDLCPDAQDVNFSTYVFVAVDPTPQQLEEIKPVKVSTDSMEPPNKNPVEDQEVPKIGPPFSSPPTACPDKKQRLAAIEVAIHATKVTQDAVAAQIKNLNKEIDQLQKQTTNLKAPIKRPLCADSEKFFNRAKDALLKQFSEFENIHTAYKSASAQLAEKKALFDLLQKDPRAFQDKIKEAEQKVAEAQKLFNKLKTSLDLAQQKHQDTLGPFNEQIKEIELLLASLIEKKNNNPAIVAAQKSLDIAVRTNDPVLVGQARKTLEEVKAEYSDNLRIAQTEASLRALISERDEKSPELKELVSQAAAAGASLEEAKKELAAIRDLSPATIRKLQNDIAAAQPLLNSKEYGEFANAQAAEAKQCQEYKDAVKDFESKNKLVKEELERKQKLEQYRDLLFAYFRDELKIFSDKLTGFKKMSCPPYPGQKPPPPDRGPAAGPDVIDGDIFDDTADTNGDIGAATGDTGVGGGTTGPTQLPTKEECAKFENELATARNALSTLESRLADARKRGDADSIAAFEQQVKNRQKQIQKLSAKLKQCRGSQPLPTLDVRACQDIMISQIQAELRTLDDIIAAQRTLLQGVVNRMTAAVATDSSIAPALRQRSAVLTILQQLKPVLEKQIRAFRLITPFTPSMVDLTLLFDGLHTILVGASTSIGRSGVLSEESIQESFDALEVAVRNVGKIEKQYNNCTKGGTVADGGVSDTTPGDTGQVPSEPPEITPQPTKANCDTILAELDAFCTPSPAAGLARFKEKYGDKLEKVPVECVRRVAAAVVGKIRAAGVEGGFLPGGAAGPLVIGGSDGGGGGVGGGGGGTAGGGGDGGAVGGDLVIGPSAGPQPPSVPKPRPDDCSRILLFIDNACSVRDVEQLRSNLEELKKFFRDDDGEKFGKISENCRLQAKAKIDAKLGELSQAAGGGSGGGNVAAGGAADPLVIGGGGDGGDDDGGGGLAGGGSTGGDVVQGGGPPRGGGTDDGLPVDDGSVDDNTPEQNFVRENAARITRIVAAGKLMLQLVDMLAIKPYEQILSQSLQEIEDILPIIESLSERAVAAQSAQERVTAVFEERTRLRALADHTIVVQRFLEERRSTTFANNPVINGIILLMKTNLSYFTSGTKDSVGPIIDKIFDNDQFLKEQEQKGNVPSVTTPVDQPSALADQLAHLPVEARTILISAQLNGFHLDPTTASTVCPSRVLRADLMRLLYSFNEILAELRVEHRAKSDALQLIDDLTAKLGAFVISAATLNDHLFNEALIRFTKEIAGLRAAHSSWQWLSRINGDFIRQLNERQNQVAQCLKITPSPTTVTVACLKIKVLCDTSYDREQAEVIRKVLERDPACTLDDILL